MTYICDFYVLLLIFYNMKFVTGQLWLKANQVVQTLKTVTSQLCAAQCSIYMFSMLNIENSNQLAMCHPVQYLCIQYAIYSSFYYLWRPFPSSSECLRIPLYQLSMISIVPFKFPNTIFQVTVGIKGVSNRQGHFRPKNPNDNIRTKQ